MRKKGSEQREGGQTEADKKREKVAERGSASEEEGGGEKMTSMTPDGRPGPGRNPKENVVSKTHCGEKKLLPLTMLGYRVKRGGKDTDEFDVLLDASKRPLSERAIGIQHELFDETIVVAVAFALLDSAGTRIPDL